MGYIIPRKDMEKIVNLFFLMKDCELVWRIRKFPFQIACACIHLSEDDGCCN
jgi:hypothetical protein